MYDADKRALRDLQDAVHTEDRTWARQAIDDLTLSYDGRVRDFGYRVQAGHVATEDLDSEIRKLRRGR